MPNYDPRRSRPTPKVAPDEESAPIDVLLGPDREPDEDAPAAETAQPEAGEAGVHDAAADDVPVDDAPVEGAPADAAAREAEPLPAPVRRAEARPSQLVQLAPLLALVLLVVVVWLRRRGRS